MNRLAASAMQLPFQFLHRADPRQLLSFISGEHPQVIAVVLAHLTSDKATLVLSGLDPERQADVAHRHRGHGPDLPGDAQGARGALERKMGSVLQPMDVSRVGGLDPLIQIINRSDRSTERLIVEGLLARDPELAEEVKSRMFMFEDITMLENRDLQQVLRQVDGADLAPAMKGVSEEVRAQGHLQHVRAGRRDAARGHRPARPGPAQPGRGGAAEDHPGHPSPRGRRRGHAATRERR